MPVMIGSVTTEITELTAVSVMLSATSPRNRWLNRLAVVPPGDDASNIIPIPSNAGRSTSTTRPKQTTGKRTSWQASATATALGCCATRRKSPDVRPRPSPNITIASAIGRPTEVRAESMDGH